MRGDPLEFFSSMVLINAGVELRLRGLVIVKRHYECVEFMYLLGRTVSVFSKVKVKSYL